MTPSALLGFKKDKEQKTILTSTPDHESFATGPIDPMVFEIAADYTKQFSSLRR